MKMNARGIAISLMLILLVSTEVCFSKEIFDLDLQDYPSAGRTELKSSDSDPEAWLFSLFATPNGSDAETGPLTACYWSPNGFPTGQCTWYADGRANQNGWRLTFSQSYGRHAYKWWDMVTNANKGQLGYPGDIMVFNSCTNLPYGHVAYVEQTLIAGKKWIVLHANWARGTLIGTICGYNVRRVTVEKKSDGKLSVGGSATHYPLLGFLYPR